MFYIDNFVMDVLDKLKSCIVLLLPLCHSSFINIFQDGNPFIISDKYLHITFTHFCPGLWVILQMSLNTWLMPCLKNKHF